jgi:hypothetical protein
VVFGSDLDAHTGDDDYPRGAGQRSVHRRVYHGGAVHPLGD